jgi:hypothetical protein
MILKNTITNQFGEFANLQQGWVEATKSEILTYELQKAKNKLIDEKRKLVDDLYSKALILQIENGFTFSIDLRAKYGNELLNIIFKFNWQLY